MPLSAFTHEFAVDGHKATASVSPCSWMYPHHGLQVEVVVAGGRVYFNNKGLLFKDATEADVVALASQTKLCPCVKCGGAAVVNPTGNRNGQCETCFMAVLNADLKKAQEKEARAASARDRKMAAKGHKFKTTAWVHPTKGGDDYQLVMHSVEAPTAAEMAKILKRRGSARTDDYVTVAI